MSTHFCASLAEYTPKRYISPYTTLPGAGDRGVWAILGVLRHILTVFHQFRRLVEAVQALAAALDDLVRIQRELGPALDRLETLEHSRHHFEAECEGMLLKADGKLKAASSAEQRERQLKKANERLSDPFDPDGEAVPEGVAVLRNDAARGEAEGVPPVHLALAPNDKTHAVKAKWGIA